MMTSGRSEIYLYAAKCIPVNTARRGWGIYPFRKACRHYPFWAMPPDASCRPRPVSRGVRGILALLTGHSCLGYPSWS
ncbi:hypothetical protein BJX61DRAFT_517017 [Aspergillus egyptiacus]|nr:hypothetical protein BJX61DRAFT_517017 [Aspergillus egyptiacus]